MEMTEEMRELFRKTYENNAKLCSKCDHKCFGYILSTYIDENGYEFFIYQHEHDSLPVEVNIAFEKFLNFCGNNLVSNAVYAVSFPWC